MSELNIDCNSICSDAKFSSSTIQKEGIITLKSVDNCNIVKAT